MFDTLINQIRNVPEYFYALKGAALILVSGLPIYLGLRYFLYKRKLTISWFVTFNFIGAFILFAGLAFLLASPLASHLPGVVVQMYLFITCVVAALGAVSLVDVFFLSYYLVQLRGVYISPPLRAVVKMVVFIVAVLPILRYVAHFNPFALVAIPTIATAVLALALQDTAKTFIAGVAMGHIVRMGDWISYEGKEGRVVGIDWARTTLRSIDGQRVFIPNTLLQASAFQNFSTEHQARQMIQVGVAYDVPPAKVKEVLVRCAQEASGILPHPQPEARIVQYSESSMTYGLFFWVEDYAARIAAQDDVGTRVWYAFRREGIVIPYPVRTVHMERAKDVRGRERTVVEQELKRWNLAEAFYNEELQELSQYTQRQLYAPGEVIVRKGAPGASLFSIIRGDVEVITGDASSEPFTTLGARDIFGEMSLLTGAPRTATVRARSSVEVLEIDKPGMQRVMAKRPELSDRLAELMFKRQTELAKAATAEQSSGHRGSPAEPADKLSKRIREFFGLA